MSREELQKAVETAELWMGQWEEDFVEDSDLDYDNEAEREAIQAFNKIISYAKKSISFNTDSCWISEPPKCPCSQCRENNNE